MSHNVLGQEHDTIRELDQLVLTEQQGLKLLQVRQLLRQALQLVEREIDMDQPKQKRSHQRVSIESTTTTKIAQPS